MAAPEGGAVSTVTYEQLAELEKEFDDVEIEISTLKIEIRPPLAPTSSR
jgi:hypothetical protein